jgi:outer membrane usher protein
MQTRAEPAAVSSVVYLRVLLNGGDTTLIVSFIEQAGKLSARVADLKAMGLALTTRSDNDTVSLGSLSGLRYRYHADRQEVDMDVPDILLMPHRLNTRPIQDIPPAQAGRGVVVNYQANAMFDRNRELAIWTDARAFSANGVLTNSGIAYVSGQSKSYLRYDTTWTHSDPDALQTTHIGDAVSSALAWSRPVRFGGLQWSRDFDLRPDIPTFPLPSFSGSAAVPTAVDVYINNVRHYSGYTPSGPFVVNQLAGFTGAGTAQLVTRDALGRNIRVELPIYVDARLLAKGLSNYSVETGFLRRYRGVRNADYSPAPMASASLRHGVSDVLTAESHMEFTASLIGAGAGGLWRLGQMGVISASLSGSAGRATGAQIGAGYQYIDRRFALDASVSRRINAYADLASLGGGFMPAATERLTFSVPLGHRQTAAVSYIGIAYDDRRRARVASGSYAVGLGRNLSVNVNAFKELTRHGSTAVILGMNMRLNSGITTNMSAGRTRNVASYSASAETRASDAGGWGWGVEAGAVGPERSENGWAHYQGRYGLITGTAQHDGRRRQATIDMEGAIVLMDGGLHGSPTINDAFALVTTEGEAGVPVLYENRVMGVTDAGGHLIVPQLNAYRHNRVTIDVHRLSADAHVARVEQDVVPRVNSGVLARFPVLHEAAALVTLVDTAGAPLPVGTRIQDTNDDARSVVGYDGLTFLRALRKKNRVRAVGPDLDCDVAFDFRQTADGSMAKIGPFICLPR